MAKKTIVKKSATKKSANKKESNAVEKIVEAQEDHEFKEKAFELWRLVAKAEKRVEKEKEKVAKAQEVVTAAKEKLTAANADRNDAVTNLLDHTEPLPLFDKHKTEKDETIDSEEGVKERSLI